MNENHIHGDPCEDLPRFRALPKRLNGHRIWYKGDAPHVKETREEKALADVAGEKWKYYQDTYRPLEDTYMKNVNDLNTVGAHQSATGAAGSATTAAFDNTRKKVAAQIESSGVNPNSGKFQTAMAGLSDAEAASSGDSKARAASNVDENYVTGLSNISAIGRGQATQAQDGLSTLAHSAQSKAEYDAGNAWNNKVATTNAVGSLAGAAAYQYNKPKAKLADPSETWSEMQWDN